MTKKQFTYTDEKIFLVKRRITCYLRHKYARSGSVAIYSIRTQPKGKGNCLARVQGVLVNEFSALILLHRLYKKIPFVFVIHVPLEELPKS